MPTFWKVLVYEYDNSLLGATTTRDSRLSNYFDPDKLCPRETLYELIWPGSQGFPGADIGHQNLISFTANLHNLKEVEFGTKKCEIKGRYWMAPTKKP